MSKTHKFLCTVEDQHCTGGSYKTDQGLKKRAHGSRKEVLACMRRYYAKVLCWTPASKIYGRGTRGFINPETGYVRLLPKVSQAGAILHEGKDGTRYMPERGNGVIIG